VTVLRVRGNGETIPALGAFSLINFDDQVDFEGLASAVRRRIGSCAHSIRRSSLLAIQYSSTD
jgi:hypothetical protein